MKRGRKRAHADLERVGMASAHGRAPHHLSAGEKKRVALAGILALEPDILVLDEPTTFLDPLRTTRTRRICSEICRRRRF